MMEPAEGEELGPGPESKEEPEPELESKEEPVPAPTTPSKPAPRWAGAAASEASPVVPARALQAPAPSAPAAAPPAAAAATAAVTDAQTAQVARLRRLTSAHSDDAADPPAAQPVPAVSTAWWQQTPTDSGDRVQGQVVHGRVKGEVISVEVIGTQQVEEGGSFFFSKTYTLYTLAVSLEGGAAKLSVQKRYSEIAALHKRWLAPVASLAAPLPLPPKTAIKGKNDAEVVAERTQGLSDYLTAAVALGNRCGCELVKEAVQQFLKGEERGN